MQARHFDMTDRVRESVLQTNQDNANERHCRIGLINGKVDEPFVFWWILPGSRRATTHNGEGE